MQLCNYFYIFTRLIHESIIHELSIINPKFIIYMKKKLFLSATLMLFVLTACGEKESLFERENAPASQEETYLFTLDNALSYAGKFQLRGKNPSTKGEVKSISQSMSVGAGQPDFHVINYTDGGFVIISADTRISPVLAYSDDSGCNFEDELPPGLQMWMDNVSQEIKTVRAENAEPSASTTALRSAFTDYNEYYFNPPTKGYALNNSIRLVFVTK
jgi:hypothetical protein